MTDGIFQTRSGKAFNLLDPDPRMVDLEDIAHALGKITRFNGHCAHFYSVAEHSVLGARYLATGYGRATQRAFLMHDAAEAYIGDICRPLKKLLGSAIDDIESKVQWAIEQRFGIEVVPLLDIKRIDNIMLMLEAEYLCATPRVGTWPDVDLPMLQWAPLFAESPWLPDRAAGQFLSMAMTLGVR